ncbi:MAG: hypothetical protein V3T22_07350 [Planctomycetota bacterium]
MTENPWTRFLALLLPLCTGACIGAPPAVDDVFAEPLADTAASQVLRQVDGRATAARLAADAHPRDPNLAVEASRALFLAADLRLQRAVALYLEARADLTLEEVLDAEDQLPTEVTEAVRGLCAEGLARAKAAVALAPEDVAGHQYRALHLSLVAWAEGPSAALFSGHAAAIPKAMALAVSADEGFEGAAPLRLEGRFRARAPWPYRDRTRARESLERAVELAPVPVNHLFLGDLLQVLGETEASRESWRAVLISEPDEVSAGVAPLHRALARRRLALGD